MKCKFCEGTCVKRGKRAGVQKYSCKSCGKYQQKEYKYHLVSRAEDILIKQLIADRVSFKGAARIIGCSVSTVQRRVLKLANTVRSPWRSEFNEEYEIDEISAHINRRNDNDPIWLTYAINRRTKEIVSFAVGRRDKETMMNVIVPVLEMFPSKIHTDRYPVYKSMIPKDLWSTKKTNTNQIERMNLTIRNRIARFTRKTLSYSKSRVMTEACVKLFFDAINWTFSKSRISI